MERFQAVACGVLCAALVSLTGCWPGMIHVSELEPTLRPVLDRHDRYVEEDQEAADVERRSWLHSTELIRESLDAAKGGDP